VFGLEPQPGAGREPGPEGLSAVKRSRL